MFPKVYNCCSVRDAQVVEAATLDRIEEHNKKIKERERSNKVEQIYRTKGLASADRSNKATLPLTAPRSHSSRLQRIFPRTCL